MLSSISPQNRFVLYRTVISERQDPDGFRLNERGEATPNGRYVVDYVGVVEVEAGLQIDKVELAMKEQAIEVSLPAIQLDPVINYRLSFPWKESRLPNHIVPAVMEIIRAGATQHAIERGILQEAQDAAQQWFTAFLKPMAGGKEVIVTQAVVPHQASQ